MLSQPLIDALNKQLNMELHASYNYLAMSAYCELNNFTGSAFWLGVQSQEEYGHAMRLYRFLIERGCSVQFMDVKTPRTNFSDLVDVFEDVYRQEQSVTASINELASLALKENAFAELIELQWFVTEQVEEEKNARDAVAKFHMIKNDPAAVLDMDRELGSRPPAAPVATSTGVNKAGA